MSNTVIQIKRSTSNAAPLLQPGELAYTSNGEVLFIGSPVGTDTANTIAIAGKRTPGTLTANQALVANNSSWIDNIQTAKLIIGSVGETVNVTSVTADGTLASVSNSSFVTSWAIKNYVDTYGFTGINTSDGSNSNTIINGDTLTIQGTTNEVEVALSGDTFTIGLPSDVTIGANLTVTGTALLDGNVQLGNNSADKVSYIGQVNTAIVPDANVSYSLGSSTNYWQNVYSQEIIATTGTFSGEVTVTGNLTVLGDLVTINVSSLVVEDSLIQLAANNTGGDALDIGFFGNYNNDGGSHEHTGLFRDATDGIYKLFFGLEPAPGTTIDTANATFQIATLQSYLNSGGLVTNATAVAITANSTVNVAIVANTLTLSTALEVAQGGTGATSFTANGVIYGNGTSALQSTGAGTFGQVLQANSSGLPEFGGIDGGTF